MNKPPCGFCYFSERVARLKQRYSLLFADGGSISAPILPIIREMEVMVSQYPGCECHLENPDRMPWRTKARKKVGL